MTPAEAVAAARTFGHHRDVRAWRELAVTLPNQNNALVRAYLEGAALRAKGIKCGCPDCEERDAATPLKI